jgi:Phage integrase family
MLFGISPESCSASPRNAVRLAPEYARVKELMRAVGLEGVSLHSLRHSFASELLSKGVPLAVVSERLGHADQNITLSIYSHAMAADTRAAAKVWQDAMADVIESSRKPGVTRMLADVSRTGTDGGLFVANKRGKVAGTTGLEPATSDVTDLRSGPIKSWTYLCYQY